MGMTIQQCKYVIEIARVGSFNEAAVALFMSQASLSDAVKNLEEELKIKIFKRSNKGVQLTNEGGEFIKYANQLVSQAEFILERYSSRNVSKRLYVSSQHYDFVAEAFAEFVNSIAGGDFTASLKERKTHEVIYDVKNSLCDLGILALKKSEDCVMERYLTKNKLEFHPFMETSPYVFLGRDHPLAGAASVTYEDLSGYAYIVYEQGENSAVQFSEELSEYNSFSKKVEITDRATLMNLLVSTECYTIGTGIMNSKLNNGNITAVPLQSSDMYSLGWLCRENTELSCEARQFVERLGKVFEKYKK